MMQVSKKLWGDPKTPLDPSLDLQLYLRSIRVLCCTHQHCILLLMPPTHYILCGRDS